MKPSLAGSKHGSRVLFLCASMQLVFLASSCFSPGIPMPGFTHREVQVYIPYIESVVGPATVAVNQPFEISFVMSTQMDPDLIDKLRFDEGGDTISESDPSNGLTAPASLMHPFLSKDYGERVSNNTFTYRGFSISQPGTYRYYIAGVQSREKGGSPLTVIYGNAGFEFHTLPRSQFRYTELVVEVLP